jgi:signal transduction histidine kinase
MKEVLSSLVSLSDFLVMSVTHIQGENIQNAAKMVEKSVQNAVKLLENLSDWANIQNRTIQLQPEIFDLQELILENVVQLRSNARKKQIELSYSVQDETYVYTDYDSASTVLHNLILNALWFTGKGGKVDVSVTVANRFVEVAVADTGIGIAHADVAKLFRIDQKFRRNGTAGEHGTGLGLVLCKDLIEMNGGQLQVESAVNLGSTFRFTLPRQEARLPR